MLSTFRGNLSRFKSRHLISLAAAGGIGVAVFSLGSAPPLFESIDNFVLFAQEEIRLEQDTQISSGDIGSNKDIDLKKDVLVSGDLFAKDIKLDRNTVINGDASFEKLKTKEESEILGEQTTPVSLPIANIPALISVSVGTEDIKLKKGTDRTLSPGDYRTITIEDNATLTLSGGTYNITKLDMKKNATLLFSASTTINIQQEIKAKQNVSIFPGSDVAFDSLQINVQSKKKKKKDDDDDEGDENGDDDDDDKKDKKKGKLISFGKNAFLNFILTAPQATVKLGERTTLRGQIIANKIKVRKGSILSRDEFFAKETDVEKIVTVEGEVFSLNEIILVMEDTATLADAQAVTALVSGTITGFIPEPQIYKLEVPAITAEELDSLIATIEAQQNPLVLFVIKNLGGGLQ